MPFKTKEDLPENVTNKLPSHGQTIYMKAFNSAWEQYDTAKERKENRSREETAHAVAWSAVKKVYKKDKLGNWVKKTKK